MADLTADPTQPIPATVPALTDGTIPHAAAFHAQTQALLDAQNRATVRVLADFTALRGISNQVLGERMYVQGCGHYEWRASSVAAESLPWIVSPGGTGRWYHELYAVQAANNGLATLDTNGRVVQLPYNATQLALATRLSATQTISATSFTDVPNLALTLTGVQVGDIVIIDADVSLWSTNSNFGYVRLIVFDGAQVPLPDSGATVDCSVNSGNTNPARLHFSTQYQFAAAGTANVRVQAYVNASNVSIGGSGVGMFSGLRAIVIRP